MTPAPLSTENGSAQSSLACEVLMTQERQPTQSLRGLTAQGLEGLMSMVAQLQAQVSAQTGLIQAQTATAGKLEGRVDGIAADLHKLSKDWDGGGSRESVPTRMALLEDGLRQAKAEQERTRVAKWQVQLAVISSAVGLLAGLISAAVTVAMKH